MASVKSCPSCLRSRGRPPEGAMCHSVGGLAADTCPGVAGLRGWCDRPSICPSNPSDAGWRTWAADRLLGIPREDRYQTNRTSQISWVGSPAISGFPRVSHSTPRQCCPGCLSPPDLAHGGADLTRSSFRLPITRFPESSKCATACDITRTQRVSFTRSTATFRIGNAV